LRVLALVLEFLYAAGAAKKKKERIWLSWNSLPEEPGSRSHFFSLK